MDREQYFTAEHIEAHRGMAPATIAEQAVHSLDLVAGLAEQELDFRFKGGNSLLLLLPRPLRYSIDVDIATSEPRDRIEDCLDAAVKASPGFTRWTRRKHVTKPWLPLASFEVHFDSALAGGGEAFIFLDAQLRKSPYAGQRVTVRCGDLYESNQICEIATAGGILGDKLLTIGPATLGIPLGKKKAAQRLKHVFDVACLAALRPNLGEYRKSVTLCMEKENDLQNHTYTVEEVAHDTLRFCALAAKHEKPPTHTDGKPALEEIVTGHQPFAQHLFAREYAWEDLQADMATVAICVAAFLRPDVDDRSFATAVAGTGPIRNLPAPLAGLEAGNPRAAARWSIALDWLGTTSLGRKFLRG